MTLAQNPHHDLEWYADVPRSIRKHAIIGLTVVGVCFGAFGAWGAMAPLAAAVITQGSFVATGQNKIIQHLEGGIIKELLVNEGDFVKVNQPIVLLDETTARTNERQVFLRRVRLESIVARLSAEAEGLPKIELPKVILDNRLDTDVGSIIASQDLNFEASLSKLNSEIALITENVSSLEFRSQGYEDQRLSMQRQLDLLNEEYAGKLQLAEKGLLRKTEIKAIERAIADAEGQIGRLKNEVLETGSQIKKLERQVAQTISAYKQAARDELQSAESELDTVREKSLDAENMLKRATILAPVDGTVVRMLYHTSGGVIESGKSIMEILPADVPLIIETQVPRTEIDNVRVGQRATVRLSALNQRTTPVLNGKIIYVSADSLADATGDIKREVYVARINVPQEEIARVKGFSPTPGMPVDVMIQTRERTFFAYLTKPIADSMQRAFMEP